MRSVLALTVLMPMLALAGAGGLLEVPEEKSDMRGDTTRVVDPYGSNAPNPLYLSSLTNKPWWDEQSGSRIPVLVTEPVGLTRWSQPVSVIHFFPAGTVPESIRVVTPFGQEIASQVRVIDAASQSFEIIFLIARLDAWAQEPLFIYYGSTPSTRPPQAAPDLCLRIEERDNSVILNNNRLQAEFSRKVGQDKYPVWRALKGQGAEYNMVSSYPMDFNVTQGIFGVSGGTPVQVVENGPVRKTISYGTWGDGYTVSLYADSPLLYVAGKACARSSDFWLPGGDTLNDVLCYESAEGLKRMPINYCGGNTPPYNYEKLKTWFTQGWFALLDEVQQQGIGWFFDFPNSRPWIQTVAYGYCVSPNASGQSALYVARDARTEPCRQAYIAWKCPPMVTRGEAQRFAKVEPRVPVLGRDFIRMHLVVARMYPRHGTNTARDCVENVRAFGGNYLFFQSPNACLTPSVNPDGSPGPALFDELARECHARGMGLGGYGSWDARVTRDMVRRGMDAVWLSDEWGWGPSCDYYPLNEDLRKQFIAGTGGWGHISFSAAERADFKTRYGADMPDKAARSDPTRMLSDKPLETGGLLDTSDLEREAEGRFPGMAANNLNDPSQLAMFRMMIDANNSMMGDMANVARENNSNVFVSTVTSPRNLAIPFPSLNAFHDLETLGDSFSSVCLDLYENNGGWLNGMVKYARGAQGNRRPLMLISGYAGWDNLEMVERNQHLLVMYGANSLCYFALTRICTPWSGLGAKKAFDFIDYTGLGEFAARAWPLEFVGVLRDQDELFASLKRKETCNKEGTGSLYEQSIWQALEAIAMAFTIPVNMISAKRLKTELQAPYKLIMVPNNPTLSDDNAALLRGFVEAGGHLIVECAGVQNKTMADLAGVSMAGGQMSGAIQMTGVKPPLKDWSANLTCDWQPVKARDGVEILATMGNNQPAITLAMAGKGKVIYFAPRVSPQAKSSEQVGFALRLLAEHAIGYVPVRIDLPGGWTTVLTDGERYVICLFNGSDKPCNGLSLALSGFPPDLSTLVSLRTGRSYPVVNGKAGNLSMQPLQPDYFMLAPSAPVLKAYRQSPMPISQSLAPGMTFLNLPPLPSKQAQARLAGKQPNTIYVGVLDAHAGTKVQSMEMGVQVLISELGTLSQVKAEPIADLQAETIGFYDVLVVPSLIGPFDQPRGWERNIRAFVEQGGRVLLLERSVGYGDAVIAADLFPEIGKASGLTTNKAAIQVMSEHPVTSASAYHARFSYDLTNPAFSEQYKMPVMKQGDRIESGFPEYVVLQPGPAGTAMVATVEGGEAVIVAGSFGKGRVVLSGVTFGCRQTMAAGRTTYEEALSSGERKLLINSVYWLGERSKVAAAKPAATSDPSFLKTQDKKIEDLLKQIE